MKRVSLVSLSLCLFLSITFFSKSDSLDRERKRAEAGDSNAQYNLAVLIGNGRGVEKDFVDALAWLNLSSSSKEDKAAKARDRLEKVMTPQQITAAKGENGLV